MIIGVPKEVKDHESRVGVTPAGVHALVAAGHTVLVEHNAGELSAMPDDDYQAAGAEIVGGARDVWRLAEMVVKVKEPVEKEYRHFREGLVLFTYLHLAPLAALTDALLANKVTGIAYETVRDRAGTLPLLTPMSEVAGRMSVQVGAAYLEKEHGGRGVLLGGVPGVSPGICGDPGRRNCRDECGEDCAGAGRAGDADRSEPEPAARAGRHLWRAAVYSGVERYNIGCATREADLVIGGVLIPGAAAPKLVTKAMVAKMKKGAVIVDVAIDQGGCIETARPTTHSDPSYVVEGVVHYCVTNMPAAVPNTSTLALTNATFPYLLKLANLGANAAIKEDAGIAEGVNTFGGVLTYKAVGESQGRGWRAVGELV